MNISVAIPSIPPRVVLLNDAVQSAVMQTLPPVAISVALDTERQGAPATRDRALRAVTSEWVAFLDDDDWFYENHLEVLAQAAEDTGADYVYSYYVVHDSLGRATNTDPLRHFGKAFDPEHPHQTTITTLVRTELAQQVGFRQPPKGALIDGFRYGEDFQFTVECIQAGAKVVHVAQKTWAWRHWGGNTSGRPTW